MFFYKFIWASESSHLDPQEGEAVSMRFWQRGPPGQPGAQWEGSPGLRQAGTKANSHGWLRKSDLNDQGIPRYGSNCPALHMKITLN